MLENLVLESLFNLNNAIESLYARIYLNRLKKKVKKAPLVKPQNQNFNNILHINTCAGRGGAARAAYDNLCRPMRERKNYDTKMLVRSKYPAVTDENVQLSPKVVSEQQKLLLNIQEKLGWLYFFNLGTFAIKDTEFFRQADILHLHNLHGGYFSPFALPELTALKPTVWTLHDEQSYTGHCAYSFECEKWLSGCGNCPDIQYAPRLEKDTTDFLHQIKKEIYDNSSITFISPSNWLKQKAEKSMLKDKDIRLIPNGIDEKVFYNYDKESARRALELPLDKKILMFIAEGSLHNPQKGGIYLKNAYEHFKHRDDILFVAIGGKHTGYTEHNFFNVSYIFDENLLAKYYAASDLFTFPTLTDNLPFVVLESLSCGTPVISFNTGGVPEEIDHLQTGYVAKYKDLDDFIKGINLFLEDDKLRKRASIKARETIEQKFTIDISINNYEKLYAQIWENAKK